MVMKIEVSYHRVMYQLVVYNMYTRSKLYACIHMIYDNIPIIYPVGRVCICTYICILHEMYDIKTRVSELSRVKIKK